MQRPLFGVGTYLLKGDECIDIVKAALGNGIRLVDTAYMYENEAEVGEAISATGVPRGELYLISKLDTSLHTYEGAIASVQRSLRCLKTPYLDLVLIHTPRPGNIVETYKGLVECLQRGLVKAIGVSNMGAQHIQLLLDNGLPLPAVNEFEVHVWNHNKEQREAMAKLGVQVIGYCPLARAKRFGENAAVKAVAEELGISEAMVALRWSVTEGLVTIPKTSSVERLVGMIDGGLLDPKTAALPQWAMERLNKPAAEGGADEAYFASMAVKAMWEEPTN